MPTNSKSSGERAALRGRLNRLSSRVRRELDDVHPSARAAVASSSGLNDFNHRIERLTGRVKREGASALTEADVSELEADWNRLSGDRGYRPSAFGGGVDARVTGEPLTYQRQGGPSFFRDALASSKGDMAAIDRLRRHSEEMRDLGLQTRDLSSTDGVGGDLVSPLWMNEEFVELARAARPFANSINRRPLPENTDSINLPRVLTGTATAAQSDLGAVQETDATTDAVTVPVRTIAGQQDMSRQFFDRALPSADFVIGADLAADYATKLDVQCLSGSGSAPNARGILNVSGTEAVAFATGSPTVALAYPKVADAIQRVQSLRFLPPDMIVMHPRRWGWFLAAVDSSGRPLAAAYGAQNSVARPDDVLAEGVVGELQGLRVVVDPSIPTTLNTNQDPIIVCRSSDLYLFEDPAPTIRVFEEVLSGTLAVRIQCYGYFAFSGERYPKATAVISGTGLAPPTF